MNERRKTGFREVVFDDLRRTRFQRDFLQDIKDLYYFYLDEETRTRLAGMGRVKRAFWLLGWLSKSMVMKLSPMRRILLLLSFIHIVAFFFSWSRCSNRLFSWTSSAQPH